MFERFRDSLVYPRRIIQYRKDSIWRVILYIILFAILMSTPNMVMIARYDEVLESVRDVFVDDLNDVSVPCVLEDGDLTCDSGFTNETFYEQRFVYINVLMTVSEEVPEDAGANMLDLDIYFNDGGINAYYGGLIWHYDYDEITEGFSDIDFNQLETDPEAFSIVIIDGVKGFLRNAAPLLVPFVLITAIIGNIFVVLFVVFLNAIILKMRFRVIPFGETFNMGVYMGTTLYILFIFIGFFSFGIFTMILFLILTFRQTNALSFEIMRRMKR